jgi:hypothetical protein
MSERSEIERDKEAHKAVHKRLHAAFDELLADFITHTQRMPSETTVLELLQWSHKQTIDPEVKA